MQSLKCKNKNCQKKLAIKSGEDVAIKCPRCKEITKFSSTKSAKLIKSDRLERPIKDAHNDQRIQTKTN